MNWKKPTQNSRVKKIRFMVLTTALMIFFITSCSSKHPSTPKPNFNINNITLAKGLKSIGDQKIPEQPTNFFSANDDSVIAFVEYDNLVGKHTFRWEWIDPNGMLYMDTGSHKIKAPSDSYIEHGSVWHQINLKGEKAEKLPGNWKVVIYMDDQLISTNAFQLSSPFQSASSEAVGMPPILSIDEISFSKNFLEGGDSAELRITINNSGPGDARDVYLDVHSDDSELKFDTKKALPLIPKKNGQLTAHIPVTGTKALQTGKATIDIQVIEPNYRVKIQGKRVVIPTLKYRNPQLLLAKFAALEGESSKQNNQIDINEIIDIKFAIQNTGQGRAIDIGVIVENNQPGVLFLGRGEGSDLSQNKSHNMPGLDPGKHETINYRYFVNSDFKGSMLKFKIQAIESSGDYGFSETKTVSINSTLRPEGYIRQVKVDKNLSVKGVVIEDIPDFQIDVDVNIPKTAMSRPDAIAVVIGNRNYKHKDIPNVEYANRDAKVMKEYLVQAMGFKPGNIIYKTDISKAGFEAIFGNTRNHRGRLNNYVKPGISEVFIFYSGHGAPDPNTQKGYFLPVDCEPDAITLNGYPLDVFYSNLSKIKAKQIVVVLDACFSGGSSPGEMLVGSASPALIKVKNSLSVSSNTTVLASSKADQISSWYNEKQHGLFTYFFLKGLSGNADKNNDKTVTLKEVYDYVSDRSEGVPYWAKRLHGGRLQEPVLMGKNPDLVLVKY